VEDAVAGTALFASGACVCMRVCARACVCMCMHIAHRDVSERPTVRDAAVKG